MREARNAAFRGWRVLLEALPFAFIMALGGALAAAVLWLGGVGGDGEDSDLGPGRGPTAHETCLWLRKIEGLVARDVALSEEVESLKRQLQE